MKKTIICVGLAFALSGCQFFSFGTFGSGTEEVSPEELSRLSEEKKINDFDITPRVYAIAATRATNKMLDATRDLYLKKESKPKLHIAAPQRLNEQLPDGFHYAHKVTNDIIEGSRDYIIVNNPEDADYTLQVLINALPNPDAETPVIEYQMLMSDKDGKETGVWSESLKQLQNDDKSWW